MASDASDREFIRTGLQVIADDKSGNPLCDFDRRILRRAAEIIATRPSTASEVDGELVKQLSDRLAMATPGKWVVQDGCSWRRIGTDRHDGNVLQPTVHPRDGHPDLIADDGKLYANLMLIVEAVNALPVLLAALSGQESRS